MSEELDYKEEYTYGDLSWEDNAIYFRKEVSEGIIKGDTIAVSFLGNYICSEGIAENISYKFRSFYGDKDEDGERLFFHSTEDCTVVLIKKVEDEEDND